MTRTRGRDEEVPSAPGCRQNQDVLTGMIGSTWPE